MSAAAAIAARARRRALSMPRRVAVALLVSLAVLGSVAAGVWGAPSHAPRVLHATRAASTLPPSRSRPQIVDPQAGVAAANSQDGSSPAPSSDSSGSDPVPGQSATAGSPAAAGAPSDAEIQQELSALKRAEARDGLMTGPAARVLSDGEAVAPYDAPQAVKQIIQAGNEIARFPYIWGGGHGAWRDRGYDCSGSVSFALAAAGLLSAPMTSGDFAGWGSPGPGHWVTIFANGGHVFMDVAGLRFDTGGLGADGTRWQSSGRDTSGFTVRHPPGL